MNSLVNIFKKLLNIPDKEKESDVIDIERISKSRRRN